MLHFYKTYFTVNEVTPAFDESNRDALMEPTIKASLTNQSSEETSMAKQNAIVFLSYCLSKLDSQEALNESLFPLIKQAVKFWDFGKILIFFLKSLASILILTFPFVLGTKEASHGNG